MKKKRIFYRYSISALSLIILPTNNYMFRQDFNISIGMISISNRQIKVSPIIRDAMLQDMRN